MFGVDTKIVDPNGGELARDGKVKIGHLGARAWTQNTSGRGRQYPRTATATSRPVTYHHADGFADHRPREDVIT